MCRSARRGNVGASDVCGAGEQTGKIGVSCVWGACFVKTWRYRARGELGNTLRRSEVRVQTFGTLFMCHVWFCVLNFDPA